MTTISPITEVPFTTMGVIKAKTMNKENNNNESILKYFLNIITSPLLVLSSIILTENISYLMQLNGSEVQ